MSTRAPGTPVIFGEVLFDRFPDGSVVLGGAPFNVAWNLQALGLAPVLVSRLGRDPLGERIAAAMARWGMSTVGLQRDPSCPTGTVDVTLAGGEPQYEIVADRAYDHLDAAELPLLPEVGMIYHGTLALRQAPPRAALAALQRQAAAPVMIDVNLREPWWDPATVLTALRQARWAKLNAAELALLAHEATTLERQAEFLLKTTSLEALCVTRGPDGGVVFTTMAPPVEIAAIPAATVVDTVGAGDAFAAVMLLGLTRDWPWIVILERAQQFAAAVVGLRGATSTDREFYEPFAKEWTDA